jgi:hypothetical protein
MLTPDKGLFALRCTLQNLLGCEHKTGKLIAEISRKLDELNQGRATCVPEFHYEEYQDLVSVRLQLNDYSQVLIELRRNGFFYESTETVLA